MDQLSPWHLPLIGYFILIGSLVWLILPRTKSRQSAASSSSSLVMLGMATVATFFTWKHMLAYMAWSKRQAAIRAGVDVVSSAQWLESTSLFQEAWLLVCKSTSSWWWSEQLCAWTVGPLTIFMAIEAKRRNIRHAWAYMLLGQVVAISTAQSLFLAAVLSTRTAAKSKAPEAHVSWTLIAVTLAALFNVAMSPRLVHEPALFLVNLLIMHVVIFAPLTSLKSPASGLSLSRLYLYISIICARLRLPAYTELLTGFTSAPLRSLASLARQQYSTFYHNSAQTSISYDVVLTSLSFILWMLLENQRMGSSRVSWPWVAGMIAVMPLAGVAVSGGLYLAARESELEQEQDRAKAAKRS